MKRRMNINKWINVMNGYKCFFGERVADVYAESTRAAQLQAAALWRVKSSRVYMISVMLCETADGKQVSHTAT